jgi:Transposase and inactivated derivatives
MFNDPLGYFITFTIHASWLHGDMRGSYRRKGGFVEPNDDLHNVKTAISKDIVSCLTTEQREIIQNAIEEICQRKNWQLHEMNVRTNHIHIVITAPGIPPEKVMVGVKARTTFRMRKAGFWAADQKLWTEHGSTVYLFTEHNFLRACEYVRDCQ